MKPNELSPQHWSKILTLLSLDTVMPLYNELGLQIDDPDRFLELLRETISLNRKLHATETDTSSIKPVSDRFLENLELQAGHHQKELFLNWALSAFLGDHADMPDWSAWEIVFSNWTFGQSKPSGLNDEKVDDLLSEYLKTVDTKDIEDFFTKQRSHPLSEWDLDMFTRHGFNNLDEYSDPYATVILMVKMHRLRKYWGISRKNFTEQEKQIICEQGQKLVTELGVWMPGPLRCIDQLWSET